MKLPITLILLFNFVFMTIQEIEETTHEATLNIIHDMCAEKGLGEPEESLVNFLIRDTGNPLSGKRTDQFTTKDMLPFLWYSHIENDVSLMTKSLTLLLKTKPLFTELYHVLSNGESRENEYEMRLFVENVLFVYCEVSLEVLKKESTKKLKGKQTEESAEAEEDILGKQ